MAKVNLYVPQHLKDRAERELPQTETLSGIFNEALAARLDAVAAERKSNEPKEAS